jgi:hypothetical protein
VAVAAATWATPVSPLSTSRAEATSASKVTGDVAPASTRPGATPPDAATDSANERSAAEPVTTTS